MHRTTTGTGVSQFAPGQSLSSSTMNSINSAVNNNAEIANSFLREYINPNVENNSTSYYTLPSVIAMVDEGRRFPGARLRFLGENGWEEWEFDSTDISDWGNRGKWKNVGPSNIIDGGEWDGTPNGNVE